MLLNVSQDLAKKKELISDTIGKPFNLEKRKELEGTVLSNIAVTAASIDLYNLMVLHEEQIFCNFEMRPKGIIISFRAKNDMYSLVIPFFKLKIYKGKAEEYSFYKDHYFIKIWAGADQDDVHKFVKKVKNYQTDTSFPRIEDIM
ncbi:hypothetical protein [Salinimicrobium gaetbulicola]|uniref:PH (Pleckstrin Homology) domain-containing protein n=1 Tax=Salinimicrobium gaetbulicola TaxID=999702 RepID=A0ABW3IKG1_9FLAO